MMAIYDGLHEWLMQHIVLPLLYQFDWLRFVEESNTGLDWVMLGVLQIFIIALVLRPLESKSALSRNDLAIEEKNAIQSDVFYCFFHRLGFFQLFFFLTIEPIFLALSSSLHDYRFERLNLENWIPAIASNPLLSFFVYLVILDFVDYLYHRLVHRIHWWWQLHALHHSQTHLTAWSDNRNHLIDDLIRAMVFASVALIIGIEPTQFVFLVAFSRLLQSWQHGYYQMKFGCLKYLLVTPSFHRYHHALRLGYELPHKPGVLGGCNFGVLFPWWDIVFGTAIFDESYHPTGVESIHPANNPLKQQVQFLRASLQEIKKIFSFLGAP